MPSTVACTKVSTLPWIQAAAFWEGSEVYAVIPAGETSRTAWTIFGDPYTRTGIRHGSRARKFMLYHETTALDKGGFMLVGSMGRT